jgi:Fic family protein
MQRLSTYIHELESWSNFTWRLDQLILPLSEVHFLQGRILGKMEALGFSLQKEAFLETLTLDVLKTSEIEGERLNAEQVRSSIARQLGLEIAGSIPSDRHVDGVVEMMLDATQNFNDPLSSDRLFNWHSALFPTGRSGMYPISVGRWRTDKKGPMQVISGAFGKEKIHFQAPDSYKIEPEMALFLEWFNTNNTLDSVIKAGVAHLWLLTIHPFDDGNGRIARAVTDLLMARSDTSAQRFYSLSAQIQLDRNAYYTILEKTQKGNLDLTEWLQWFLETLIKALKSTDTLLKRVLFKGEFWQKNNLISLNDRQKRMLNKILDGFDGHLTSDKWAKISKCSKDTAIRDLNDLLSKNILQKDEAGGRSTRYRMS